jgi:hypothetical protein
MIGALMGVPGKLKTLLDRLTATRAGYLDNLDAAISTRASASVWTSGLATELGGLDTAIAAIPLSVINSIQAISITMSSASSATQTITGVVVAKSVVVFTGFSCDATAASANFHHVMSKLALTNTTTVTASRNGSTGTVIVNGFVVEFK